MSLQAQIDSQIAAEDTGVTRVSIAGSVDGQDELTTIYSGIHLNMFYSVNLNLVHEGNGFLFLYKCHINSLVTNPGTKIILYDCKFLKKLELYGTSGRIEGSDPEKTDETDIPGSVIKLTEPWVKIEHGCDLKFIRTNFKNTGGARRIAVINNSKVAFIESRDLQEFLHGISGEQSRIRIIRSSFFVKYKCVEFVNGSNIHVSSSHLKGNEDMCLALAGNCTAKVVDCTYITAPDGFIPKEPGKKSKGLFGAGAVIRLSGASKGYFQDVDINGGDRLHDYGINCDLGSKAVFVATRGPHDIKGGAFAAIRCDGDGSSVKAYNYRFITAQTEPGVVCTNGGSVFVSRVQTIDSGTQEAVRIGDGGKVELENAREVRGKTWGITMLKSAQLLVDGTTQLIEGDGDDGILANEDCKITLDDVTLVSGNTAGIKLRKRCSLTLLNTPTVQASAGPGITTEDGCVVLAQINTELLPFAIPALTMTGVLQGQLDGLVLGPGSSGTLVGYKTIEGLTQNGIVLGDGASLQTQSITNIHGLVSGVVLGKNCRWHAKNIESVVGDVGYGIYGDEGCSFSGEAFKLIDGLLGGFWFLNRCDYLHIYSFEKIHAVLGDGLKFDGKNIIIDTISLVQTDSGQASGIVVAGAQGKIANIAEIDAAWTGIVLKNSEGVSSQLEVLRLQKCEGRNSPHGIDIILSQVRVDKANFIKDGLVASGTADFSSVTFSGALVSSKSTLKFANCRVDGHFQIEEVSYDILNTLMQGEHISTDSSGVSRNYTQLAKYTGTNEGAVHTNLTLGANVLLSNAALNIERGTIAGSTEATDSTLNWNQTTATGQVKVISGTLHAEKSVMSGGLDAPQSSADLLTCQVGAVTLNESSFNSRASQLGAVTAESSSLEMEATEAGSVTVVSSSLEMKATSAGSVTATGSGVQLTDCQCGSVGITGGGLVAVGGELGNVNVASSSFEIISSVASISGVHKAGLTCVPGRVVYGGNDKLFVVFDEDVSEFYKKNVRIRVSKDYEVNVGNDGGSMAVRVKSELNSYAGKHILLRSPIIEPDYSSAPAPPEEPPT